ncbi:MAG: hypothetical protein U0414_06515 [Polyangiaceae bacterium]
MGHRVVVLGSNERWTSFVPMDAATKDALAFDGGRASKVLDRALLHVWFDDDVGVFLQSYASGELVGEISLPGDGFTEKDFELLGRLEALDVLDRSQRSKWLERLSDANGLRAWTMQHGLEKLLDLPFYEPLPPVLPAVELQKLLPRGATVLEPRKAAGPKRAKTETRSRKAAPAHDLPVRPSKATWTVEEQATLDLHVAYWASVFSMNNWKLYNRYKKHLPANQRRDVDALCSAVALGNEDAVADSVKSVLARVWGDEDWDAVIRDPALVDGEREVWEAWLARISAR